MVRRITEYVTFIRESKDRFFTTGAVLPSGRQLCCATIQPYVRHDKPARVLEVGPGTGAVTQQLVKHLKPGDVLDIVEVNDQFVATLRQRFANEPAFQRVAGQATVHHMPVQQFLTSAPYDFIMCGLPFNNFPRPLVEEIFLHFEKLLAPGGVLSFFEYLWIRRMKSVIASKAERQRLAEVGTVLDAYIEKYQFDAARAFVNIPPAVVRFLRLSESSGQRKDDTVAA